jgi:hypothetical protein
VEVLQPRARGAELLGRRARAAQLLVPALELLERLGDDRRAAADAEHRTVRVAGDHDGTGGRAARPREHRLVVHLAQVPVRRGRRRRDPQLALQRPPDLAHDDP